MKPVGAFLLLTLMVAIGLVGVAEELGDHHDRAVQCIGIFAVIYGLMGLARIERPHAEAWYYFGEVTAVVMMVVPSIVWLGMPMSPPVALLLSMTVASAATWGPALARWLRCQ